MMPPDEIVAELTRNPLLEEIWEIREKHAAKFHYDLKAIFADLRERQKASGRTIIYAPARKIPSVSPVSANIAANAPS
jgi:predicted AAA+ superfamily ATPase